MDNLAHTLVGAAIGRAVAGNRVPAAAWIGAVAANAPDWTELFLGFNPWRGSLAYYVSHRGITHAFIGAAVETVLLASACWLFFTMRRRSGIPIVPLLALAGSAVGSHLYMDWQGSYGLRPWLPWSGQWYYADWVAIVDPLFWVVPLVGLAWGSPRHWGSLLPVVVVAVAPWLVAPVEIAVPWLRATWIAVLVIGAIGWVRHWFGVADRRRAAAAALLLLASYAGAQGLASVPAKAATARAAGARFGAQASWAALTRIGAPFTWERILASPDSVAGRTWAVARHLDDARVRQVVHDTPAGRALAGFARFLIAEVDSSAAATTVVLRDARFARPPAMGWAVVRVGVPDSVP